MGGFPTGSGRAALAMCTCLLALACRLAAADVQVRLVPRSSPGGSDALAGAPPEGLSELPSGAPWFLEIWATDLPDGVHGTAGLIAAFLDVRYNPAIFPAVSAHHSALFPSFLGTEPTIDPSRGSVMNFGGVSPSLNQPRGVWPEWVRVGWLEYDGATVPRPTHVSLTGETGVGGVGCFGRSCGAVEVVGNATVIVPDVASGGLLTATLALVCRRGRRRNCEGLHAAQGWMKAR